MARIPEVSTSVARRMNEILDDAVVSARLSGWKPAPVATRKQMNEVIELAADGTAKSTKTVELSELLDKQVVTECVCYLRKHNTLPIDSLAYICQRDFLATFAEFSAACKEYINTIWGD